ncbi:MAG: hypothetical protein D4R65_11410 [Verrucomicrobiaceae bacterium]|nr:MAG: hypothetical protein D4R65_11410 [Verrucomicrobiaceae bacterium]
MLVGTGGPNRKIPCPDCQKPQEKCAVCGQPNDGGKCGETPVCFTCYNTGKLAEWEAEQEFGGGWNKNEPKG